MRAVADVPHDNRTPCQAQSIEFIVLYSIVEFMARDEKNEQIQFIWSNAHNKIQHSDRFVLKIEI